MNVRIFGLCLGRVVVLLFVAVGEGEAGSQPGGLIAAEQGECPDLLQEVLSLGV
jgi:hypothetical protein